MARWIGIIWCFPCFICIVISRFNSGTPVSDISKHNHTLYRCHHWSSICYAYDRPSGWTLSTPSQTKTEACQGRTWPNSGWQQNFTRTSAPLSVHSEFDWEGIVFESYIPNGQSYIGTSPTVLVITPVDVSVLTILSFSAYISSYRLWAPLTTSVEEGDLPKWPSKRNHRVLHRQPSFFVAWDWREGH